jgi:hypothetical protein
VKFKPSLGCMSHLNKVMQTFNTQNHSLDN